MNENEQPSQLYMSNMEESTGLPFELCESLSEELINIITYSSQTDGVCTLPNSSIGVTDALRFLEMSIPKIYEAHACPANSWNISQSNIIADFCNGAIKAGIFNKGLYHYFALKISNYTKYNEENLRRFLNQK